jgi:tetratricopeptide (TPR) repeat protein
VPHWLDADIRDQVALSEPAAGAVALDALVARGLATSSGTTFSIHPMVRAYLLDGLAKSDAARLRELSRPYAALFLSRSQATFEVAAEGIYHTLAVDPDGAATLLLNAALTWKDEPLFAFDAVDRLAANAIEQRDRGLLGAAAAPYITFVELMVPRRRPAAADEAKILAGLLASVQAEGELEPYLKLRLGQVQLNVGEIDEALGHLRSALSAFTARGDERRQGEALRAIGRAAVRQDRYADARRCFDSAAEIFTRHGLRSARTHCTEALAQIDFYQGDYRAAARGLAQALDGFRETGAAIGEANTRILLSQLLALQGHFAESEVHIEAARAIYTPLNQRLGLANAMKASGVLAHERGDYAAAIDRYRAAKAEYGGSRIGRANCDMLSASSLIECGETDEAAKLLGEAAAVFAAMEDRFSLGVARQELGLLDERRLALSSALATLAATIREFDALPNPVEAAISRVAAGRVAVKLGFPDGFSSAEVAQIARSAEAVLEANGVPRRLKQARELMTMLATLSPAATRTL